MKTFNFLIALFFLTDFCRGQDQDIQGTITDKKSGRSIKNADVLLYNSKDSLIGTIRTSKKGYYHVTADRPGTFYIKIVKRKYSSKIVKDIKVPFPTDRLDITLEKYFDIGLVY